MRSARDQDIATGVISLGLLANKLAWFLSDGQEDLPLLRVNEAVFDQWKTVLRETIDFIQTPGTRGSTNQPRFLSRAQYLEQIYTAAPESNRKDLKALSMYLEAIYNNIEKLSQKKNLKENEKSNLLAFTRSIASASIQQASKFHQEAHVRRNSETTMELSLHA